MPLSIPWRFQSLGTSEQLEHWPHGRDLSPADALTRTWTGSTLIFCDAATQRQALRAQIGQHAQERGGQAVTLGGRNIHLLISEAWGISREHPCLRSLLDLLACTERASVEKTTARLKETLAAAPLILIIGTEPGLTPAQQERLVEFREEGLLSLVSVTGRLPSLRQREPAFPNRTTELLLTGPALAEDLEEAAAELTLAEREQVITLTGGQPDFVNRLLEKLGSEEMMASAQRVEKAANTLFREGSPSADKALGDLAETLEVHPGTRDLLEECVRGTRGLINRLSIRAALPLMVAGWIRFHRGHHGGWYGIRSWLHQGWARPILMTAATNARPRSSSLMKR